VAYGSSSNPTLERLFARGKEVASKSAHVAAEAAAKASVVAGAAAKVASAKGLELGLKAQRAAKASTSSDFERLLLRATSPVRFVLSAACNVAPSQCNITSEGSSR